MVRAFGVVSQQLVEELVVKGLEVGEQKVFVVHHKLLLQDPVETFAVGVHLGCSGEGVPLRNACRVGWHPGCYEGMSRTINKEQ